MNTTGIQEKLFSYSTNWISTITAPFVLVFSKTSPIFLWSWRALIYPIISSTLFLDILFSLGWLVGVGLILDVYDSQQVNKQASGTFRFEKIKSILDVYLVKSGYYTGKAWPTPKQFKVKSGGMEAYLDQVKFAIQSKPFLSKFTKELNLLIKEIRSSGWKEIKFGDYKNDFDRRIDAVMSKICFRFLLIYYFGLSMVLFGLVAAMSLICSRYPWSRVFLKPFAVGYISAVFVSYLDSELGLGAPKTIKSSEPGSLEIKMFMFFCYWFVFFCWHLVWILIGWISLKFA